MNKVLEKQIEQTQKIIADNKEWQQTYDKQANVLLENREVLKQFYKSVKDLEHLQFYITEVLTALPTLFKITVRYYGADIATVELTKDEVHISTEPYNKSNKDNFECTIQLKNEKFYSKATNEFLQYFRGATIISKGNEKALTKGLLLQDFSLKSSVGKLLLGCQPIKHEGLFLPVPVCINKGTTTYIDLLRTKVRKITVLEIMGEGDTQDTAIQRATDYSIFLLNLLHTETLGDKWYKIFGFHGRNPVAHTIKVVIAENKTSKGTAFEPYEVNIGADTIQFHHLEYQFNKDNTRLTNIKTTVNE